MRFDLVRQRQLLKESEKGRQAGRLRGSIFFQRAILRVGGSPPIGLIEFPVELQLQFRLQPQIQLCLRLVVAGRAGWEESNLVVN